MPSARKPYPSDVSDEKWALVAPYLTLLPEEAGQREHSLREVLNGLRYIIKTGAPWRWMPNDLPPWAAVYQQAQRWLNAAASSSWRMTFAPCCAWLPGAMRSLRPP
jgi:transposase